MSSNEDEYNDENGGGGYQKKRRIQRACDICRRKKIRCDGVQMPGNRCSNCIAYSFDCTYVEAAKKRGPPKGYVESLENRVERLEKLLKRLCPDEAVYKKLTESLDNNWMSEKTPSDPSMLVRKPSISSVTPYGLASAPSGGGSTLGLDYYTSGIRNMANEPNPPPGLTDDDDDTALILSDNLKRMELEPHEYRFFGKSSGAMLVRTALELKNEYTGADNDIMDLANPRKRSLNNLRAEFWTVRPWERDFGNSEPARYTFPEVDLAKDLVDLYFRHSNLHLPLLHRPTFEKWIDEELHLTNENFAPVYLLVCAVGARHSSDPRVRLDGISSLHSCGWKWFRQWHMVKRSLLTPPSLFDLQAFCLMVQYLQGSSAPQSCWTLVGIGIRLAQDVGAHRRKVNSHKMTAEDEMWKRAFWVLVCMDRMISSSLGRPCAIQDEDFDLDLPVDCDDEYWDNEDPEKCFKQPAGKPSSVSHFILFLKLHQILAFSLRTIYSINKSKVLLGFVGQQWEQHIVAELDSALNKWVDSVPDHLRWDPNREDEAFFSQSVSLYAAYYHVQILIHRPFIPSPSKPSPLSFPSLAICTNAARSCCHVVDIQRRRNVTLTPQTQMAVFTSGIVLLLSIWGGKRSGLSTDPVREMAEVHKCMDALRKAEDRWHSCGRLWDILYELASVGDLPLPQHSPPATNKRERDSETPISSTATDYSTPSPRENMPRTIAGSRRVRKESPSAPYAASASSANQTPPSSNDHSVLQAQIPARGMLNSLPPTLPLERRPSQASLKPEMPPQPPVQYYSLPVYSNELGRLPLHGQVAFSSDPAPVPASSYWATSGSVSNINVASGSGDSVRNVPGHPGSSMPNNATYPATGEMSSMTTGFPMDATAIAAGMMFDAMAGTLNFGQQQQQVHQQYQQQQQQPPISQDTGLGFGVAAGMERLGHGSGGGFMDGYRALAMDTTAGSGTLNDTTGASSRGGASVSHVQENMQEQNLYSFVDNDTIEMWSNAPSGFELDDWGTYLNNVSELTQHGHQFSGAGAGNTGGRMQHQHHTNHMT